MMVFKQDKRVETPQSPLVVAQTTDEVQIIDRIFDLIQDMPYRDAKLIVERLQNVVGKGYSDPQPYIRGAFNHRDKGFKQIAMVEFSKILTELRQKKIR